MVYVEAQFLNIELSFLHKIDKRKCYLYNLALVSSIKI